MPESINGAASGSARDHAIAKGVAELVRSSRRWFTDALQAWVEGDQERAGVLAPIALEHLCKAALWRRNPVLLVQLSPAHEDSLLLLADAPRLDDERLRTIGLGTALERFQRAVKPLVLSKAEVQDIVRVRNGAVHLGASADAASVLSSCLQVAHALLEGLGDPADGFFGDRADLAQALMAEQRNLARERVLMKRARARERVNRLRDMLGQDQFDYMTVTMESEAAPELDELLWLPRDDLVFAMEQGCPECGSAGRMYGEIEEHWEGPPDPWPGDTFEWTTFEGVIFSCNVCRLFLDGAQELSYAGIDIEPREGVLGQSIHRVGGSEAPAS